MLTAGTPAPPFRLPWAHGGEQALSDLLSDGPVLLAFYKVSCPVCQYTFPFLERVAPLMRVVGIAQDDADCVGMFSKAVGISFPSLIDHASAGYPVSNAYRIRTVPSLFLVDPDGRILSACSGFSRAAIAGIGDRIGAPVFRDGERVPDFRPG